MRSTPVFVGPLVGVHVEGSSSMPTVVILNAGLLHRVGPNRMSVTLAQRLAEHSVPSFRFDLSGLGDSESAETDELDEERAVSDIRAVLDHLDEVGGTGSYVLAGLCTGAFNAFRTAERDHRVVGAILIDGYAYPTARSRRRVMLDRWLNPRLWVDRAIRRIHGEPRSSPPDDLTVYENVYVSEEEFGDRLERVLDRNLAMLLMFTRFGPLSYTYRTQICDNYPHLGLEDRLAIRYYPRADHTFTLEANRDRAIGDIVAWMSSTFGRS